MYIEIKSTNPNGIEAMKKLLNDKSMGIATKILTCDSPYTIKITPKGIQRYIVVLKNNPYIIDVIEQPMRKVLIDYGAKPNEFDVRVIMW